MVLLDSGSTHNSVSEALAAKLGLQPIANKLVAVVVAFGEKLSSKGKCTRVTIKLGGFLTQADFYVLPLEGYEVIMENQWLRTLGEILWDFSKLTMKFRSPKGEVVLKGLSKPEDKVIDGKILR